MTSGRKATVGQQYIYKQIPIKFDGEYWHFGEGNIQKTLSACKRVIDANLSPTVAQSPEERIHNELPNSR